MSLDKKQVAWSITYAVVGFLCVGLLWYLSSTDSVFAVPVFVAVVVCAIAFNPIVGNVKMLRDHWKEKHGKDE